MFTLRFDASGTRCEHRVCRLEKGAKYSRVIKFKGARVRGQLSIEFIIVLAGLLIILGSITLPMYERARGDAQKSVNLADAKEAATALANALNTVYAGGVGARQTVEYWLPKGVAAVYARENIDDNGTPLSPSRNGRMEVQVWFDLDGDGLPDFTNREAVVVVETLLPSKWYENGELRPNWENECPLVEAENLKVGPAYKTLTNRTRHRTTFTYTYELGRPRPRRILVWDENMKVA